MTEEQASKITREQLYNEIWEISVAGVAKKYNANYNDLLKLCKEADVPVPPSGYWVKLQFGKPVEQLPLPESIAEVTLPGNDKLKRIRKAVAEKSVEKDLDHKDVPEKPPEDEIDNNYGDETGDNLDDDDIEDEHVPYWGVSGKHNTYKREKLYKEVWANPVVKVAAQYGVSDVAIHKICKKLNVPTPPLGYWAKVNAGAKVPKTSLPKTNMDLLRLLAQKLLRESRRRLLILSNNRSNFYRTPKGKRFCMLSRKSRCLLKMLNCIRK